MLLLLLLLSLFVANPSLAETLIPAGTYSLRGGGISCYSGKGEELAPKLPECQKSFTGGQAEPVFPSGCSFPFPATFDQMKINESGYISFPFRTGELHCTMQYIDEVIQAPDGTYHLNPGSPICGIAINAGFEYRCLSVLNREVINQNSGQVRSWTTGINDPWCPDKDPFDAMYGTGLTSVKMHNTLDRYIITVSKESESCTLDYDFVPVGSPERVPLSTTYGLFGYKNYGGQQLASTSCGKHFKFDGTDFSIKFRTSKDCLSAEPADAVKALFPSATYIPIQFLSKEEIAIFPQWCGMGERRCRRELKSSQGEPALYYAPLRCGDALCDTSTGISVSECTCSDPNAVCAASINGNAQPLGSCCIPSQTCSGKCGAIDDGCGRTLNCPPCCIPKTCSSLGLITGSTSISDGCAGQISCGCSGGRSLQQDGSCCTPKTCSSFGFNEGHMFMASNGCGSTIPCSCPNGQTLVNGDCKAQCIPTTKYPDASMNCGYVDDGCGGSVQLATCSIPGQVCSAFKPNTCGTPLKDSDYVSLLVADVINLSPTCAASCLTNIRSLSDLQTATSAANLTAVCDSIMNLTGYKSCATSACQSSTTNIDRVSTFVETIQTHCIQATLLVPVAASYSAETKILTFTWTGNSGSITALSVSLDGGKTFLEATIVTGKPAARRSNNKRAQSVSFAIPSFTFPSCKVDALVQYSFCQGTLDLFGKCLGGAVSNHQKAISLNAKEFPGSGWPLKTCASGLNCGTASDGCDGVISCGECSGGGTCLNNKCPAPTLTSSTTTASTVLTASTTTATATSSTTSLSISSSATSTAPTELSTATSATSTVSTGNSVSTTANSSSSTSSTSSSTTAIATPATTAATRTASSFTINCGTGSTCFLCVVNNSNSIRQECKQGEVSTPLIGATTVQPNQQQVYACIVNGSEQVAQLCNQGSKNAVPISVPAIVASEVIQSDVIIKVSGGSQVVESSANAGSAAVSGSNAGVGSSSVGNNFSSVQTAAGSVNVQPVKPDAVTPAVSVSQTPVVGKNNLFVMGSGSISVQARVSGLLFLFSFFI